MRCRYVYNGDNNSTQSVELCFCCAWYGSHTDVSTDNMFCWCCHVHIDIATVAAAAASGDAVTVAIIDDDSVFVVFASFFDFVRYCCSWCWSVFHFEYLCVCFTISIFSCFSHMCVSVVIYLFRWVGVEMHLFVIVYV